MEFRCANTLHFKRVGDNIIEVKCRAKRCGAGKGNVVLHRFNLGTGELVDTSTFKDPKVMFDSGLSEQARAEPTQVMFRSPNSHKEEQEHDADSTADCAAVRSA